MKVSEVTHKSTLSDDHLQKFELFNSLFDGSNAHEMSYKERETLGDRWKQGLVYGEVRYLYFIPVFELLKPKPGEVFWDLGCGAARPQAMASLNFPFLKACKGIEYLKNLSEWATDMAKELQSKCKAIGRPFSPIEVVNGDMLEVDWFDADIILFNSVCYPDSLV